MNLIPKRRREVVPVLRDMGPPTSIMELKREMDHIFDRFLQGSWLDPWGWSESIRGSSSDIMPSIDMSENDEAFAIRAELPGLDPEDVDISVSGHVLTLRGEKKESIEEKGENFSHCERRFGSFTRSIELGQTADMDEIEAENHNGILTIHVKKVPVAGSKKVAIKPGRTTKKRELVGAGS